MEPYLVGGEHLRGVGVGYTLPHLDVGERLAGSVEHFEGGGVLFNSPRCGKATWRGSVMLAFRHFDQHCLTNQRGGDARLAVFLLLYY